MSKSWPDGIEESEIERLRRAQVLAEEWLLSSPQYFGSSVASGGAFRSWYDTTTGRYIYASAEVTGYGITMLVEMAQRQDHDCLLARACSAVEWLERQAFDPRQDCVWGRYDLSTAKPTPWSHTFDQAMVVNGLANFSRATGDAGSLEMAERLGRKLLSLQDRNGGLPTYFPVSRPDNGGRWSARRGAFLVKVAQGLLNLHDMTGATEFADGAIRLCDWALRWQDQQGMFGFEAGEGKRGNLFFHPHCYAIEGLMVAGLYLGHETYLAASQRGLQAMLEHQLPGGGFPWSLVDGRLNPNPRSDVVAQFVRLMSLTPSVELSREAWIAANRALTRLLSFQQTEGGPEVRGAFLFGSHEDGHLAPHANTWCTMFAIQALRFYLRRVGGANPATSPFLWV
jgi:uncharacterized protein YyaL (SSP411 family)